jgi:cell growth-regulating nucleolar protein
MKAIEYHPTQHMEGNQLVVYRTRQELFLSFVRKGPDSEKGCSINKALKRYHRDRSGSDGRGGLGRIEEEKELWKGLRLKRNDRGEIVIFQA